MPWTFFDNRGNSKSASVGLTNPQAKIYATAAQSITTNGSAYTQVLLPNVEYDTDNCTGVTSNAIVIKTAGRYEISGKVYFNGVAGGTRNVVAAVNGSVVEYGPGFTRDTGTVSNGSFPQVVLHKYLNVGDVVTLWVRQDSGSSVSLSVAGIGAELSVTREDQTLPASTPTVGAGMSLICSQVLTATQANFDTNTILGGNIPGTYNHLRLMFLWRTTIAANNDAGFVRFNGDAGANYDYEYFYGQSAYTGTNDAFGQNVGFIGYPPGASQGAGIAGVTTVDIPCYAQTTFEKAWQSQDGWAGTSAATSLTGTGHGTWRNTGAITRIATSTSGSFVAGSAFYLYGIL